MAVALGDFDGAAIDFRHPAAALEHGGIGAEPHGAAEIAVLVALLKFIAAQPFRHQAHQRLRRRAELGGVGLLDADKIARRLDHGHLHAEADTEIRHVALARELDRKSTRLNSSHMSISYAVFCLKKKKKNSTKIFVSTLQTLVTPIFLHTLNDGIYHDPQLHLYLLSILRARLLRPFLYFVF